MDSEEILVRTQRGICDFYQQDTDLLTKDAIERSISHKLAEHLQRHFDNLKVDCEYNRHGYSVKSLRYSKDSGTSPYDLDAKTVFPDIIIHKRGTDQCNLGIIEIKKSNSNHDYTPDIQKLRSFTGDEYKYQLGLFLVADVKNKRLIIERIFRCGQEITDEVFSSRERLEKPCDPSNGVQTRPFGSQLHQHDCVPIGTPIITIEHLEENRIRHQDVSRVSDEDRERISK